MGVATARRHGGPRSPAALAFLLGALLLAAVLGAAGCGNDSTTTITPQQVPGDPFAYDRDRPLRADEDVVGSGLGVVAEDIDFQSFDGELVPATLLSETEGSSRKPCVLFVPGLGNPLTVAQRLALALVGTGYRALTVEPRFHGSRTAGVSAEQAARNPQLLAQMLRGSVIDLRRALDYLVDRDLCIEDEAAYVGLSFGGILGALLAGADARIGAAALVVAGGDWRAFVEESDVQVLLPEGIDTEAPERFETALELLEPLDPVRWIGRAAPRPVLMINGTEDQVVPRESATALHEAAREPKQVFWFEGSHNPFVEAPADEVGDEISKFLDDWRSGL
ncbi:MAG: alpha/beta hydrolase family protein [Solirubrobacterales bacterium]